MATVKIITPREQSAHFGLYRTSAGGDEAIFVRRKVGEPTDYLHTASRKLKQQRYNLTLASQHYAHLSPSQKAITRHQIAEVEYQTSHGKTDTKLLMGRQLFISREMSTLKTTGKQFDVPHEVCIILADPGSNPIPGELWLSYLENGDWHEVKKDELATGSWLFSEVPRRQEAYRVYGESPGFHDPRRSEHQFMTEAYLLTHHYHKLVLEGADWGYSFGSAWWSHYKKKTLTPSPTALHVYSRIQAYDFSGTLTVAVWRTGWPYIPEDEIGRRTFSISPSFPDYNHFYSTFSGLPGQSGVPFWLRHWKSDFNKDYWTGIIRCWNL